MIKQKLYGPIR